MERGRGPLERDKGEEDNGKDEETAERCRRWAMKTILQQSRGGFPTQLYINYTSMYMWWCLP